MPRNAPSDLEKEERASSASITHELRDLDLSWPQFSNLYNEHYFMMLEVLTKIISVNM